MLVGVNKGAMFWIILILSTSNDLFPLVVGEEIALSAVPVW